MSVVEESGITGIDGRSWVEQKEWKARRQELDIKVGNEHLSFTHTEICNLRNMEESVDPEGLRRFYCLVQNLKMLVLSLIILHFKVKSIP